MGITKQAKNITICAKTSYKVRTKELVEIADKINYEAHKDNLVLNSNKAIDLQGEDGGVTYNDYSPPEMVIEESEFLLESTFALEQLLDFAKKCKAYVPHVVLTIVDTTIPEKDVEICKQIAQNIGVTLRIRPFED